MPYNISFMKLGKKNRIGFEKYFNIQRNSVFSIKDYCFGIMNDEKPLGVVILKSDKTRLIIDSIEIDYEADDIEEIMQEVLCGLVGSVNDWGFEDLIYKCSDITPGIKIGALKKAGFKSVKEEAVVYSISAYSLGTLLRDGPDAIMMRTECVRILNATKARIFSLASNEVVENYKELGADPEYSFLTLDEEGNVEGCSIVSTLSDGTHYLSELYYCNGNSDDIMGLLYLSLSKIFMDISPDGEFFIPAVKPYIITIFQYLLSPLDQVIEKQRIFTATTSKKTD